MVILWVLLMASGSLATEMNAGDLDLSVPHGGVADASGSGDDDAVGDDDAAYAPNGAAPSPGGGASPANPYLLTTKSAKAAAGGGKNNRYADIEGGRFHDKRCHIPPGVATTMVTKCLAVAVRHSPTTCALCVAPMLPHGCVGDAAVDFCRSLKKDAPSHVKRVQQQQQQQQQQSQQSTKLRGGSGSGSKSGGAKAATKAAAAGSSQPSSHESASEKTLDSRCAKTIAHRCSHALTLQERCVDCAAKLRGAGPCANADESRYLCGRLVKQRAATVHKAKVKANMLAMRSEREGKGHIRRRRATMRRRRRLQGAAGLAHDMGHAFDSKSGLAATENSHFRPKVGFSSAYGEIAGCLLDRSQGVYDTFETMATCSTFAQEKGWDCYALRASDLAQDIRFCCAGGEHLPTPQADARCRKAILPVLEPIETHVVPFYEHCVRDPSKCLLFRKEFTQCIDMRNAAKHIEGESFVCQQALLKVFMPILQKAIAGARAMFKGAPKTDVTKLALTYMDICPPDKPVCDNVAALVKFQSQFDEAELNPWDN